MRSRSIAAVLISLGFGAVGCGGTADAVKAPDVSIEGQTSGLAAEDANAVLVLGWTSFQRADLESARMRGLVVMASDGDAWRVLDRCRVAGGYRYHGLTQKKAVRRVQNGSQLTTLLPVGSLLALQAEHRDVGALRVELTLAGEYRADPGSDGMFKLEGECAGATHVVKGISVGAFRVSRVMQDSAGVGATALDAEVMTRQQSQEDSSTMGGTCASSNLGDSFPPNGCGEPLGVHLLPLAEANAKIECPAGTQWNGMQCANDGSVLILLMLLGLAA